MDPRLDDVPRRHGVFGIWLVQGLDGAPAALGGAPVAATTHCTRISLPLVFLLAAAQALFFWNVLQTLRGKAGVATFDERGIPCRRDPSNGLVGARGGGGARPLALAPRLASSPWAATSSAASTGRAAARTTTRTTSDERGAAVGDPAAGAKVFASAGCGGCHTLVGRRLDRHRRPRRSTRRSRPTALVIRPRDERDGRDAAVRRSARASSRSPMSPRTCTRRLRSSCSSRPPSAQAGRSGADRPDGVLGGVGDGVGDGARSVAADVRSLGQSAGTRGVQCGRFGCDARRVCQPVARGESTAAFGAPPWALLSESSSCS